MARKRMNADRAGQSSHIYGAAVAGIIEMDGADLDKSDEYMRNLREKAEKVSRALKVAGVPHAVIGGMAVLAHVFRVNPSAGRNTRDLDILVNREDVERGGTALKPLGFRYRKVMGLPVFFPPRAAVKSKSRFQEGVHLYWAGE